MILTIEELISLLSNLVNSTDNYQSITNNEYKNYLSNYHITNNLTDKSIIDKIVNYNITCYQNDLKFIEDIEEIPSKDIFSSINHENG